MPFGSPPAEQDALLQDFLEKAAALSDLPNGSMLLQADLLDEDAEEAASIGEVDAIDGLDTIRAAIYEATGYRYEGVPKKQSA